MSDAAESGSELDNFQADVLHWLIDCFGQDIAADKVERNHRFLEESLELVQSLGCTKSEAHMLVDYVFDRDVGEPDQELGGVMVTLAALCHPNMLNMKDCALKELQRIQGKKEQIRKKHKAKPRNSPLPQHVRPTANAELVEYLREQHSDQQAMQDTISDDLEPGDPDYECWQLHEHNKMKLERFISALTTAPEPKKGQTEYMTCDKQFSAKPEPQDRVSIENACPEELKNRVFDAYESWRYDPLEGGKNAEGYLLDLVRDLYSEILMPGLYDEALQQQESGE